MERDVLDGRQEFGMGWTCDILYLEILRPVGLENKTIMKEFILWAMVEHKEQRQEWKMDINSRILRKLYQQTLEHIIIVI
jgi:hypothetical protein